MKILRFWKTTLLRPTIRLWRVTLIFLLSFSASAQTVDKNKPILPDLDAAVKVASQFVDHGFVILDFENAANRTSPEAGLSADQVRLGIARMVRLGFPQAVVFTHYTFEEETDVLSIYGSFRNTQMRAIFRSRMKQNTNGQFFVDDFTVSHVTENWSDGMTKLPNVDRLIRFPYSSTTEEYANYIQREPLLRHPGTEFLSFEGKSYAPAVGIYQTLFENQWGLEIEYTSDFAPFTSEDILREAESAFLKNIYELADKAGVDMAIMTARQIGSDKVYRILFRKSPQNIWARASS